MPASNPYHYQRNPPHRLPPDENIFVTFRLAGSLPQGVLEQLRAAFLDGEADNEESYARQRRYCGRFDEHLAAGATGPLWLQRPAIAQLVQQALHFYDGKSYSLACCCIMANHVHVLVNLPEQTRPLASTLQALKGYTASRANKLPGQSGQFWQRESYDHIVRDAAGMERVVAYVLNNPVKAGLVADWQQWPYPYRMQQ